jgi:hypothetical protein
MELGVGFRPVKRVELASASGNTGALFYCAAPRNDISYTIYHMRCLCLRCGKDWESRKKAPRVCRWCNSPYWNKPITRPSVSLSRRGLPVVEDGPEEVEEDVPCAHPAVVVEAAAKASAPFGRSVADFLLSAKPKIAPVVVAEPKPVDEWQARCVQEFGERIVGQAAKGVQGWGKLSWQRRHEALCEKREREQGNGWA